MREQPRPVHPGTVLLEQVMQPLGVSRNRLARDIDVPVGRISDITNGKRGITADTALRLARYFGTDAELWMRLQAEYDLQVARRTTWPEIEPRVRAIHTPNAPRTAETAEDRLAGDAAGRELSGGAGPASTEFAGTGPPSSADPPDETVCENRPGGTDPAPHPVRPASGYVPSGLAPDDAKGAVAPGVVGSSSPAGIAGSRGAGEGGAEDLAIPPLPKVGRGG